LHFELSVCCVCARRDNYDTELSHGSDTYWAISWPWYFWAIPQLQHLPRCPTAELLTELSHSLDMYLAIANANLSAACSYCVGITMGWYMVPESHALRHVSGCLPWHTGVVV
jgi:hypothetical protein